MCGITGVLDWHAPPDVAAVRRMTTCLAHRGPDADGVLERGPVVLGHRRLSIIDVSATNNQPLADTSGQLWITYNGEIYNYREIRAELQAHGATFRTQGDTEVILEAYRRWGDDCLTRLNGMFVFALWDEPRQRLLVARDRAGEKPLYYQPLPGGGLAFASELKALRLHPAVCSRINPSALGHFLSINYTLTEACILDGVQKLPAAHYLVAERDRPLKVAQYWDLAAAFRHKRGFRTEEDAADELRALLDDAVKLRLVSDVPLGAFLSGGIDSSAIVAAMAKLGNPRDVRAFTIGFNEQTFDELPQARVVARTLAIDHYERVVDVDMAKALPTIVAASDEPFADTSAIPVYYLAEFARQHVTVALSGDGSDEILAGYETYAADQVLRLTRRVPRRLMHGLKYLAEHKMPVSFDNVSLDYRLRKFLRGQPLGPRRAHYYWRIIFDDAEKRRLLRPGWRQTAGQADPFDVFHRYHLDVKDCDFLDQALYVDFKTWLVDDILVKVDRATMAHSLESRAPYLDHRLVEFAAALPADLKLKRMRKKHLLKESQRPRLPRSVIDRKKQGFNTPVSQWYTGGMLTLARSVTTDPSLGEWFEPSEIDRLWREHLARKEDHGLKLFGLTCFGLWIDQLRVEGA